MDAIARVYDGDIQMIDSTWMRAHQEAAMAKRGSRDHSLGRARGGLTTKFHAVVDRQVLPLRFGLTTGQAHDAPAAPTHLDARTAHHRAW